MRLSTSSDPEPLTDELIGALLAGIIYLGIHMAANTPGQIGGQILPSSGNAFSADQETHALSPDTARGTASLTYLCGFSIPSFHITIEGLRGPERPVE